MHSITLGQYYPSDSRLHKLDPRMKLIAAVIFIVSVFLADNLPSYIFILLSCMALAFAAKIPSGLLLKSIKPLIYIIAITAFFNVFWTKGETLLTPKGFFISIYLEGIISAFYMIIRLVSLVLGTLVLISYTTTPIALTHGMESLLYPLSKIKVPVHEFAMMMSIALRFIPTLMEETEKIINAQKARGADFETGGLIKRAKAFIPIMIPLFVSAFRRADELATAMESRCYNGSVGRTRMNVLKFGISDFIFIILMALALFVTVLLSKKSGMIDYGNIFPKVLM